MSSGQNTFILKIRYFNWTEKCQKIYTAILDTEMLGGAFEKQQTQSNFILLELVFALIPTLKLEGSSWSWAGGRHTAHAPLVFEIT